jgi:peptide/nickel transport system permease protein
MRQKETALQVFLEGFVRLCREPLGLLGLIIVLLVFGFALLADSLVLADPIKLSIRDKFLTPSLSHPFGTDFLGRDVYSRVVAGSRIAMTAATIAVSVSAGIGLFLGILSGMGPRWLDYGMLLLFDTLRSFPVVMFALAVVTLIGPSLSTIIFIVIVISIPLFGRAVRTQTLTLKSSEFIQAEIAMGASFPRLMGIHILPNVLGPVMILAAMEIPVVISMEAGLSFLGFGVRPPTPSWGNILNDGFKYIRNSPWPLLFGGLPIIFTTLGFTFLGESLRNILDPRLRKES